LINQCVQAWRESNA